MQWYNVAYSNSLSPFTFCRFLGSSSFALMDRFSFRVPPTFQLAGVKQQVTKRKTTKLIIVKTRSRKKDRLALCQSNVKTSQVKRCQEHGATGTAAAWCRGLYFLSSSSFIIQQCPKIPKASGEFACQPRAKEPGESTIPPTQRPEWDA